VQVHPKMLLILHPVYGLGSSDWVEHLQVRPKGAVNPAQLHSIRSLLSIVRVCTPQQNAVNPVSGHMTKRDIDVKTENSQVHPTGAVNPAQIHSIESRLNYSSQEHPTGAVNPAQIYSIKIPTTIVSRCTPQVLLILLKYIA
jgi:hypothetical protein